MTKTSLPKRRSRRDRGESSTGDSDRALKYLMHKRPAEFSQFALDDPRVEVVRPVEVDLPARARRTVDGGYLMLVAGQPRVSHTEFHRRHQSSAELALDVGEAQLRLYRRQRLPVVSQVWDLYGEEGGLVRQDFVQWIGPEPGGTRVAYRRVNLRGLPLARFLEIVPPALWPLAPLARGGASLEATVRVRDAIEGCSGLSLAERTDRLAVLRLMAEIEGVTNAMLREHFDEDRLMQSTFYRSAVQKGQKLNIKKTLNRMLTHRLGHLEPDIQARIESEDRQSVLETWQDQALSDMDEASAKRLVEQIRKAPPTKK